MKRILLVVALIVPVFMFGQSYDALWKQVEKASQNDLPQTEQQVLKKIISKAEKEKAYGHLLKAELKQISLACEVSSDSLKPAVERLEVREKAIKDEALRAVYQTVLGLVYEQNSQALDDSKTKTQQYFDQAMANPSMLASKKVGSYVPFVIEGVESKIYDNDLLSLLGTETRRYDVMHRYYEQTGNRPAAMLSALNWLREQETPSMEKLEQSRRIMTLDSLLEQYCDLQEACEVAMERYSYMTNNTNATNQQRWEFLEMALSRWGKWKRADYLRYDKSWASCTKFNAFLNSMVNMPSATNEVILNDMRGVTKMTMRVYRVDATAFDLRKLNVENDKDFDKIKKKLNIQPELTQERTYTGKAPYELYNDTLKLQALPVGVYLLEFESSPKTEKMVRMLYYVSNQRMLSMMLPGMKMRYVVVDAETGQPVKGAQLKLCKENGTTTLTTNGKGECEYSMAQRTFSELYVTTEEDNACPSMSSYGYFSYYKNDRVVNRADIFTDRAIYRPGQTIQVSAILYKTEKGYINSVEKGKTVTVILRDANQKEVESKELTTDDFGTCATSFTLPRQGLTGRYSIVVDRSVKWFRVEEYKRPTFEVDIPTVKTDYANGDTLQVKGTARSYAGVPVQGANVTYKVMRRRAYWWWSYSSYWNQGILAEESEDKILAEGEVMTDADGTFTVPTPITVPMTRYTMFYNFVVTAEVTDQAGETHRGELSLPLGNKKTALSVELPEKVLAESTVSLLFHLRNAAGTDLDAEVRYRYTQEGKRSQAWQKAMTNKEVSLAKLKSGKYLLEAICGEDTLKQDFVVFSLDDKRPATKTDDWFCVSSTKFPNDGTPVTVQVGSSDEDVHIVYTILSGDEVLEKGTVDQSNALINRKFTYKEEYGNGLVLLYAWIKNDKIYIHESRITRPVPDTKLHLKWETFRDRLVPGQQEEWTLSVLGSDGKPVTAQLMATLYDKSLDQLTPHSWSLVPYTWLPLPSARWNSTIWGSRSGYGMAKMPTPNLPGFQFNAFDHSVFPVYVRTYGRSGSTRRLRGSSVLNEVVLKVQEKAVDDADLEGMAMPTVADNSLQGRIAGLDIVENKRTTANGLHLAETEEETPSEEMAVQVRENLNETAFFYPRLMADGEGRVTVKFTLPESLTTWRFMSLAHTQDMKVGMQNGEAVAKKDVMIMPNVPRFIRMGDKATISARIFNSGEKMACGKARMQLLDPETDEVVFAKEQQVSIAADSTLVVTFTYDAKDESRSLLVLKMMVSGEDFSDGEQHYLPILPNKERVTVTVPFTQIEPGTKTIDLNSLKPQTSNLNSQLTIEYTNNPAWFMIQALPTVGHPHDKCAICQASSYYANAIGRHILKQNPQAKNVFEAWSHDDVSLQSSLQKNQELKDLLLNETPWVADANREQEQKERLSDFFDENLIQQRLNSSVEQMKALQLSDGSWSWWPGMSGSLYMTIEISEMLVRLNQMTGKQSATATMLDNAFGYMGKEMVKMVNEMKKAEKKGIKQTFPSHKALQWLYICTLDGRKLSSDVQSANTYLINLLKKETKNQSIYDKAMSAIVLNNKTYIKSLKEYTVYREDMGRYYDARKALYSWRDYRIPTQVAAIEAIKRLTPNDTKTIEEMQRWLLQEKRTQAWDTPINSADAVYAFLNGNSESLKTQEKTILKVDGKEIETSQATAGIGYVKTTMSGDDKQQFTAEKTSTGTSWGAVYMQFMQLTSDVESQNSGISVKREILSASNLKVGDRIKVRITIEADRDYDFVQVVDKRAACMEPVNQLSGYHWGYYIAPKDCSTNYYFDVLSKGKHVIETEYYIDRIGTYETGTCTASCAYSPEFRGTAKSQTIEVK